MKATQAKDSKQATQTEAIASATPSITLPIKGKPIVIPTDAIQRALDKHASAVGRLAAKVAELPADEIGGRETVRFDLSIGSSESINKIITALTKRNVITKDQAQSLRNGFALVQSLRNV